MAVIPASGVHCEFKAGLSHLARLCLKNEKKPRKWGEGVESASGDSGFSLQQQRKKKNEDGMQGSMAMSAVLILMNWVKYSFQRLTITKLIRVTISLPHTGRTWRS